MLEQLTNRVSGRNVAILGVGNPLRGDDGAGPALIERLQGKVRALLIDAGDVPENYLGPIEAFQPQTVLIVDAALLGAAPGDIALVEKEGLANTTLSTHNASLALFSRVIQATTDADILLLAIQPETTAFGSAISARVDKTLAYLEELLIRYVN